MKQWLAPLGIFITGQLILLVLFIFMPGVDSAVNQTATATANITATGNMWGWGWLMGSGTIRWLLYMFGELLVLFAAGMALYKSKT
jgi:hypothetical protein